MKSRHLLFSLALLASLSLFWAGCSPDASQVTAPTADHQDVTTMEKGLGRFGAVIATQNAYTPALMASENVVGTAVGLTDDGRSAIMVLTVQPMGAALPTELEGHPVVEMVTGRLHPISGLDRNQPIWPTGNGPGGGGGGGGTSTLPHDYEQSLPIQLGTTGGWQYDLANGYCCGGTFGSLITDGSNYYVLSNTHVLAMDIVLGGNNRVATIGDSCIHPALIDVGCVAANATSVATLASLKSLPQSNVDAAIARIIPGAVQTTGSILEIGTLSNNTVAAYVNQTVKKSGRTTGLTHSYVTALNGTVSIAYEDECAGNSAFTHTFYGQIVIANSRSSFLAGGDSGSLMVEDVDTNPRAVGLLFAGSSLTAIANPIDEVLDYFGSNYTMVGN